MQAIGQRVMATCRMYRVASAAGGGLVASPSACTQAFRGFRIDSHIRQQPDTGFAAQRTGAAPGRGQNPVVPGLQERLQGQVSGTSQHHAVMQKISGMVEGTAVSRTFQRFGEWRVNRRMDSEKEQQINVYEAARDLLMAPERWTYGNMLAYQRKLLELLGGTGWRARFNRDETSIKHLMRELRVLEAMNPVELASNHKSVFTKQSIDLIAEKSKTRAEFVRQVIFEHDVLRGDRRWYQIRQQFGQPLPRTLEDRQFMAEYDRPFCESEREYRQDLIDREMGRFLAKGSKQRRVVSLWVRRRSIGGNRWSTRPPRWYPTRWGMRPEKRARLQAAGHQTPGLVPVRQ
mmetsp:Transcript_59799/g.142366  ORF Transcript_59799/g.142366 Transcript_59799/m.142366 type:complete len:346 (+) Transcript_59799:66-1103(+)